MDLSQVLNREEVSPKNQELFDALQKKLGFVPNLYATYAHSENALGTYLQLQGARSSLNAKAREVINLVVSQVNECQYCLAAHTAIGKMSGFSDAEILELRQGRANFDAKFDALARLVQEITVNRGTPSEDSLNRFFAQGWTAENLVDTIMVIGDKIISNFLHKTTLVPVDFPVAPELPVSAQS